MKKALLTILAATAITATFAQKNKVKIETTEGTIVVMLYDNTPLNTANMVKLAKEHYYDSTLFHRVIPEFMIQGGDPKSKQAKPGEMLGSGDLGYTVPAEIDEMHYHKRGSLAVARDGNAAKAGSACQFYIVVGKKFTDAQLDEISQRSGRKFTAEQRKVYAEQGGTPHLDGNYTVFGEVLEGMDVVDKIVMAPRDRSDRPNSDIRMTKVRLMKKKKKFLFF